jgi:hypothetical protein
VARRASPSPVTPGDAHAARPAPTPCARPASRRTRHAGCRCQLTCRPPGRKVPDDAR